MISKQEKEHIIKHHKHTMLGYERINKKLGLSYNHDTIDKYITNVLVGTSLYDCTKIGKNYYFYNSQEGIRVTINSHSYSVITVDRIK
ncbi:hypothetical protein XF24_00818 [candidate division SR1 bacterium Aalborg_AAW-1]|nr:hypothetical protein XF24_00818 [candidate division SR1 bacterium Aalborg_AAW-1]